MVGTVWYSLYHIGYITRNKYKIGSQNSLWFFVKNLRLTFFKVESETLQAAADAEVNRDYAKNIRIELEGLSGVIRKQNEELISKGNLINESKDRLAIKNAEINSIQASVGNSFLIFFFRPKFGFLARIFFSPRIWFLKKFFWSQFKCLCQTLEFWPNSLTIISIFE